jgi:protease IV
MRQFLKQTLASTVGSLLGLTLFSAVSIVVISVTIGAIIQSASDNNSTVAIADKSILTIDLSHSIVDINPGKTFQETLAGDTNRFTELKSVLNAIDAATTDKRIVAIYLDGNKSKLSTTGFATLKEVRSALERFRATGKKIIAYNIDMDKRDYYLSSVANQIFINPMGSVDVNGFRSETMFFKNAFDKYGIGVEVIRAGKYKSFGEAQSLTKFSPEARQETQQLLNNLWGDFKTSIGTSRQLAPAAIQQMADDRGTFTATQSVKNKLVDRIAYPDEILTELKKIGGADPEDKNSFRKVALDDYAEVANNKATKNSHRKIAVIYAQGEIVSGEGGAGQIGGDSLARQLRELRADKDVKAVVLRVNSPGGSALASDIIQREVKLLQQVKPVVTSMGDVAASGGYSIATFSNKIFAEANTITGSIGVIGINYNYKKLGNNNGITWDVVKTSKLADGNTVARPRTPQELAISQQVVDDIYDDFITKVSESRKLPKQKVAEIAQGRIWSGTDAKKVGLVDDLGGLNDAIAYAAQTAKLGKDWELEEYPVVEGWEAKLLKRFASSQEVRALQSSQDPLTTELLKVKSELSSLKSLNDPRGVYVRLPFNFKID